MRARGTFRPTEVVAHFDGARGKTQSAVFRSQALRAEPSADFLVPLAVLGVMGSATETSPRALIEGSVSGTLQAGAERAGKMLADWLGAAAPIIEGPTEPRVTGGARTASFFSGGVDSFYSLWKNQDRIDDLITIYGFDFKVTDQPRREHVGATSRAVAEALGKELLEVETDVKTAYLNRHLKWGYAHGGALASVAMLFEQRLATAIIPASFTWNTLFPWGSHPELDPLWSTEALRLDHDGCEATRVEKVAAIAEFPLAMKHLRVCYDNRPGTYNCGECEKCLRTQINLAAVGALDRCDTLPTAIDYQRVSRIVASSSTVQTFLRDNLEAVEKRDGSPQLADALRTALTNTRGRTMQRVMTKARWTGRGIARRLSSRSGS